MNPRERWFTSIVCLAFLAVIFWCVPARAYDAACFRPNKALMDYLARNGFELGAHPKDASSAFKMNRYRKTTTGRVYTNTALYDEESDTPLALGFYKCKFFPNDGELSELHKALYSVNKEPTSEEASKPFVSKFGPKTHCDYDPARWYILYEGRYLIVDVGMARFNLWTWLISLSVKDVSREISRDVWKIDRSHPLREEIARQFELK